MSDPLPTRQECARQLGRRVSKGEYERIFSGLIPKQLKTVKRGILRHKDGTREVGMYRPIVASRVPESPKAQRKKASRNG